MAPNLYQCVTSSALITNALPSYSNFKWYGLYAYALGPFML